MSGKVTVDMLTRGWEAQPTEQLARWLLGKIFLRRITEGWIGGVIVETEAYLSSGDPACHAARGPTNRNRTMFGPPGHLYVYSIHAKWCANVVTEPIHHGAAVLLRAIEPVWGQAQMRVARGVEDERNLTRGPARLCQALQLDQRHNGVCCVTGVTGEEPGEVAIAQLNGFTSDWEVAAGPRIGISAGAELPLRFFIRGNRFVSGRAADHGARPVGRLFAGPEQPPLGELDGKPIRNRHAASRR